MHDHLSVEAIGHFATFQPVNNSPLAIELLSPLDCIAKSFFVNRTLKVEISGYGRPGSKSERRGLWSKKMRRHVISGQNGTLCKNASAPRQ
jgi:hypothetical protein